MTWPDVIQSGITVAGALGGALAGSWISGRITRQQRAEDRQDAQTTAAADAVREYIAALNAHRTVMRRMVGNRLASRLAGGRGGDTPDDVMASHATRAGIDGPLTTLCLRVPQLADQARAAARTCYAIHRATRTVDLERRRAAALRASEEFVDAASQLLGSAAAIPADTEHTGSGSRGEEPR